MHLHKTKYSFGFEVYHVVTKVRGIVFGIILRENSLGQVEDGREEENRRRALSRLRKPRQRMRLLPRVRARVRPRRGRAILPRLQPPEAGRGA